MKQKPGVYSDSFWGDLANAIALKPVYRKPLPANEQAEAARLGEQSLRVQKSQDSTAEQVHLYTTSATPSSGDESTEAIPLPAGDAQEQGTAEQGTEEQGTVSGEAMADKPVVLKKPDGVALPSGELRHLFAMTGNARLSASTPPVPARVTTPGRIIRRLLRKKPTKQQLTNLGLSPTEAQILMGLYKGSTQAGIARSMGKKEVAVTHAVQRLLGRFGVSSTDALLKVISTMTSDRRKAGRTSRHSERPRFVRHGLEVVAKDAEGDMLHRYFVREKQKRDIVAPPVEMTLPKSHPDHPANDLGKYPSTRTKPGAKQKQAPTPRADQPPKP